MYRNGYKSNTPGYGSPSNWTSYHKQSYRNITILLSGYIRISSIFAHPITTIMLLEYFYTVHTTTKIDAASWSVVLTLNPQHALYQGHFPEHPIVPGVCMLQLIKECTENICRHSLQYAQISSCKFLSPIDPTQTDKLELTLSLKETEAGEVGLLAEGNTNNTPFIKLKAQLIRL